MKIFPQFLKISTVWILTYRFGLCHLADLLKFEAVLDGTVGLLDCQQLFCSVNPSTDSEKPLA